jgi:anti-sigma-K factor RskA
MKKNLIATTALVATAAAGTAVLTAAPANADVERRGSCAGAVYELNVDRERGGFEVSGDLEGARAGSEWKVTVRHDGTVATSRVLRADHEGELDVETWRRNTGGTDTFTLSVKPVGGSACSLSVSLR